MANEGFKIGFWVLCLMFGLMGLAAGISGEFGTTLFCDSIAVVFLYLSRA